MPSRSGGANIPARTFPTGRSSPSPGRPAGRTEPRPPDKVIYYQYRADRGRRTLRGIDEQVVKAEKAVAGLVPVKRNRFITLAGGQNSVNRELEAKARRLRRPQGLHHQPRGLPGRHPGHGRVRDRLLPPVVAHRDGLSQLAKGRCGPSGEVGRT